MDTFERSLPDDKAAIAFAMAVDDAASVEILYEGRMVARIAFVNGKPTILA